MVFDILLKLMTTVAYGSIAWFMIRQSVASLPAYWVNFSLGVHFGIVVLRTVMILFWRDDPVWWAHVHRVTAMGCMAAIAYEVCQEKRGPHDQLHPSA
ncbi:MAG: hypothetical protein R3A44_44300 [Caldilineaceae bacterium]